jgi:hypothetical protein
MFPNTFGERIHSFFALPFSRLVLQAFRLPIGEISKAVETRCSSSS